MGECEVALKEHHKEAALTNRQPATNKQARSYPWSNDDDARCEELDVSRYPGTRVVVCRTSGSVPGTGTNYFGERLVSSHSNEREKKVRKKRTTPTPGKVDGTRTFKLYVPEKNISTQE